MSEVVAFPCKCLTDRGNRRSDRREREKKSPLSDGERERDRNIR